MSSTVLQTDSRNSGHVPIRPGTGQRFLNDIDVIYNLINENKNCVNLTNQYSRVHILLETGNHN